MNLQKFPYPAYHEDDFVTVFSSVLPLFTVISFVMLCPASLKRVVEEKETGVRVGIVKLVLGEKGLNAE